MPEEKTVMEQLGKSQPKPSIFSFRLFLVESYLEAHQSNNTVHRKSSKRRLRSISNTLRKLTHFVCTIYCLLSVIGKHLHKFENVMTIVVFKVKQRFLQAVQILFLSLTFLHPCGTLI